MVVVALDVYVIVECLSISTYISWLAFKSCTSHFKRVGDAGHVIYVLFGSLFESR